MADEERIVELLSNVPLFKDLEAAPARQLGPDLCGAAMSAGEIIVPQGRDGYGFFVVASGAAKAVRQRSDGSETVVNTFGPSDFFGELALLDDGPRTATVVATEPTVCLILPRVNFLGALRRDGDMAVGILVELAKRFRTALDAL